MMDTSPRAIARALPGWVREPGMTVLDHIQQGTFQR